MTLTHVADKGLTLKHTATADDKPIILTLATGETDMAANDVMGRIDFQAPDEGEGTDAILVAASIAAIAEGDFSGSNNATKLSFMTAESEAAAEKMSLDSTGMLTVAGGLSVTKNSITETGDAQAAATVTQNARAGSIAYTTNGALAANTGFIQLTVNCDEVAATDVIAVSIVNILDASDSSINSFLTGAAYFINAGNNFKIMIMNRSSVAVPDGGKFTVNWAIL